MVGGDDGAAAGLAGDEVAVIQGRSDRGDDTPGGLHGFGVRGVGDLGGGNGDELSRGGGETRSETTGGGGGDLGVIGQVGAGAAPDSDVSVEIAFVVGTARCEGFEDGSRLAGVGAGPVDEVVDVVHPSDGFAGERYERFEGGLDGHRGALADVDEPPVAVVVDRCAVRGDERLLFEFAEASVAQQVVEGLGGLVETAEGFLDVVCGESDLLLPGHVVGRAGVQDDGFSRDASLEGRRDPSGAVEPFGPVGDVDLHPMAGAGPRGGLQVELAAEAAGVVKVVEDGHQVNVAVKLSLALGYRAEQQHPGRAGVG